jgi:hypothetical protein
VSDERKRAATTEHAPRETAATKHASAGEAAEAGGHRRTSTQLCGRPPLPSTVSGSADEAHRATLEKSSVPKAFMDLALDWVGCL